MQAKLHTRGASGDYYRVTDENGHPLTLVLVTSNTRGGRCGVAFDILAEAYPAERKSILAAVIAAMH